MPQGKNDMKFLSWIDKASKINKEIMLPADNVVVDNIDPNAKTDIVGEDIPDGKIAVVINNLSGTESIFQLWIEGKALKSAIPAHGIITMVF